MIVDLHTHIWDAPGQMGPSAAEWLLGLGRRPWEQPDATVDAHLQAMQRIDAAVVLGFESRHAGASVSAAQVARHVARQPDKLVGFAGIDPLAGRLPDQVKRAADLGMAGVVVSPAVQDFHPTHSDAMRLYEACASRGWPVLFHGATHFGAAPVLPFADPVLLDEVARAFPTLPMVVSQVGHPWVDQALVMLGKHRNVFADITDLVARPWQLLNVLHLASQMGVWDKLLLGSDFPYFTAEKAIAALYGLGALTHGTPLPGLSREKLRRLIERDSLACLGVKAPGPPRSAGPAHDASPLDASHLSIPAGSTHAPSHAPSRAPTRAPSRAKEAKA